MSISVFSCLLVYRVSMFMDIIPWLTELGLGCSKEMII